jgi:signal transduction histidine kinase
MSTKVGALKVLLVGDDEPFAQAFALRLQKLTEFTCTVEHCSTGAKMLDVVFTHPYDLIFLDVHLPDMDGLEVVARLARTSLPLPVVMISRNNNARTAVEAMKRGVLDFLITDDLLTLDLTGLLKRQLEAFRLRRENAELRHISQMKDDFLATISHELRTPLTSILGLSEVLLAGRMGPLQEKQSKSMEKILEQCHNLIRLINQLLDIRAFLGQGIRMETEAVSLREMVGRQANAMQNLFEKKGVQFTWKDADEALMVQAHRENLNKVVEHLIFNALKFTPRGGAVTVEIRGLDTGQVQLRIQDTGRGIPPEALPHIFNKFFHVDQTLTRAYGGMGLGLAFRKEVIEGLGGRVWVESKGTDLGTTVSFLLPRMREVPVVSSTDGAVPPKETKKTVLWVDDNPNLLELVEYGFAGFPHPVNLLTAQSGVAALAKMKTTIPDLVVLDIMMSDIDGLEVLDRLRKDPATQELPILVVTGYLEAARTAMQHGADDYCLKPFRVQDVLKKIEALLYSPQPKARST